MRRQLVLAFGVLLPLLAHGAFAQTSSSSDPFSTGTTSPQVDCTDPLLANSSTCTDGSQSPSSGSQIQNFGQAGAANIPGSGSQQIQGARPQNYNDAGNISGQNGARETILQKLPPEPLTEFQKFVAGTTGQVLPIFGADLFQNAPSTFAPMDQTPIPPDYVIGPGDLLRLRLWGQVNFTADVRVDRAGEIYIPQVGPVHVAGLPFQALDQHVREAVSRVYRNFDLTADIGQIRAIQVYVVGQAHRPGTYTVSSLSTLVDTLFASGGPSVQGSLRHIYLKRGGKTVVDFDLYDLLVSGDKSKDTKLESGDILFIPAAGPEIALTGSVRKPGIYELRDDTSMQQILTAAGGASTVAAESRISIERIQDHQDRTAMEVAFDATGLATALRGGDIIRVLSIVPMYQKTVTLRGNTANPGRFAWHAGMHVADLIPDRESLLTRDYWWRRTQLGLPAPDFEPVPYLAAQSQPTNPVDLRFRAQSFPRRCLATTINGTIDSNANGPTNGSQNGTVNGYNNLVPCYPAYSSNPTSANNNNNNGYGGNPNDLSQSSQQNPQFPFDNQGVQQPGGYFPDQSSQQQQQQQGTYSPNANQQAGSGTLADRDSGLVTQNTAAARGPRTTVQLSAPEIDWDYAVIERLDPETLKTSLITFDLGKLVMQHDAGQNIELQAGDVISVFSQADIHVPIGQQTKFVRLEGEFLHSGTYSVQPGETLRQLVERAGGMTGDAYLYGSQFTRERTRMAQQQRIDEYVQSLQLQIVRGTLAQSSSAVSSAQDLAAANSALASERELISKLQQIKATGRMVLEVKPDSAGIDSLPDLPLEDGDRFIVPSVPASVNVVGSVYDQNSFIFHNGRRVEDYLHLAGGPDRNADRKRVFVIRADGSVLSRQAASGVWGNTFDSVRLNPGDTIVMPEKTFGASSLRGFLEFSQLFSSLAFGAAAISILQ
ncbi:protein involved in polysaccharide export with SLBB domain [Silvibacterium bohemicum]|uniref:Protein involved in polysaccharide export with SLBB domain n=1 Tax=Silvibacterium bohemicum TaxID=1577686 RepID=A0A841JYC3_9BACT|nr:SLBB domain-containing protein [Silvibacterium bohemicum]MBB6146453.1 protein involved in polysaccharide export with SLBB domain [Silvibacterium bohemicum]